MQIVRVYTGTDGESHFEDLTPEQLAQMSTAWGMDPGSFSFRIQSR